jgi:hypothetical protein
MYYLTKKVGSKKYAIAEWVGDDNACPRLAEIVFSHYGYNTSVYSSTVEYKESVERQRIYQGKSEDFRLFTDTLAQAEEYFDRHIINSYVRMGKTKEYILDLYPEYDKYFEENK